MNAPERRKWLQSYLTLMVSVSTTWIARAILVSNEPPIVDESTEKEDIRFAVFPPNEQEGIPKPVTILQLSNEGMTCPRQKCKAFRCIYALSFNHTLFKCHPLL